MVINTCLSIFDWALANKVGIKIDANKNIFKKLTFLIVDIFTICSFNVAKRAVKLHKNRQTSSNIFK
jgi:hypothetical protein